MLWLRKNQSIKKVSLQEYLHIIQKQDVKVFKILQYSNNSCVCLTTNNTIVKVLNPSLAEYQFKNLRSANKYFLRQGIKTPNILNIKKLRDFYIIESEYINNKLFIEKIPLIKADKIFFKLFSKLSKKSNTRFGPLTIKNSLITPFTNHDYIRYWDDQFEYFLNKISKCHSLINDIKKCYRTPHKKISTPSNFILTHSDVSPKHVFIHKSQIGCIDIEDAMYLDTSFMWSLWYVRTIHKRSDKLNREFFRKVSLKNLDLSWFNLHICRELFIQYYYQGLLNYFLPDYSKFLNYFHLTY